LILGLTALIAPIKCRRRIFLRDYKFLFFSSILFIVFSLSGTFVRWHGVLFLLILIGFIYYNYLNSKKEDIAEEAISPIANKPWLFIIALTLGGLFGIIYGADLLIKGAVGLARILGVSEEIIGLTIIAVGTSLPELATTLLAAIRGQARVALGNVIGSNIWNIVFIIGATSTITDISVPKQFIQYDIWIMTVATIALYPAMMTKARLTKKEGGVFLAIYILYIATQILISRGVLL
jgi:cation:H+ antiporter